MEGLPPNTERAALGKILAIVNDVEDCKAALWDIQKIAVAALHEPAPPGDYWHGWLPDPEHINALPQPIRQFVHDLATNADPAGMVAENVLLADTVAALEMRVRELEAAKNQSL